MSAIAVLASQTRYNLLASVRSGLSMALGVAMPIGLFLFQSSLFGSFGDDAVAVRGAGEVPNIRTFYVGGFMAYAIVYGAFVAVVAELVDLRERGLLKRLQGTPLPLSAFVAARFAISLLIAIATISVIGVLGALIFDATLRGAALIGLAVTAVVGVITFTCLSFAAATVSRSLGGAQALANFVGIGLAMISGVFFATEFLPTWVRTVAQLFPLEPLSNSFQSLYASDASGSGIDARNLAVLAAWTLASLALIAVRGFRWTPQQRR